MNESKPYGAYGPIGGIAGCPPGLGFDPEGFRKSVEESARKERRERIATAVLAGFAASDTAVDGDKAPAVAVRWADTLIAELDK